MKNKYIIFIVTLCVLLVAFSTFTGFAPSDISNVADVPPIVNAVDTWEWNYTFRFRFPSDIFIDSGEELYVFFRIPGGGSEMYNINDGSYFTIGTDYVYEFETELDFFLTGDFYVAVMSEYYPPELPRYVLTSVFVSSDGTYDNGYSRDEFRYNLYTNGVHFIYTRTDDEFAFIECRFESAVSSTQYNNVVSQNTTLTNNINTLTSENNVLRDNVADLQFKLDQAYEQLDNYGAANQGFNLIENAFHSVGNILKIEILPGIQIGTFLAVPLILGVVFLVLRLVRGE